MDRFVVKLPASVTVTTSSAVNAVNELCGNW